jgi:hypothetical protein
MADDCTHILTPVTNYFGKTIPKGRHAGSNDPIIQQSSLVLLHEKQRMDAEKPKCLTSSTYGLTV